MQDREVLQGVLIFGVAVEGSTVNVDIYGSSAHLCGSLRYSVADGRERRTKVALLRDWERRQTPVTMVTSGSTITLVDDRALIEQLFESVDLAAD